MRVRLGRRRGWIDNGAVEVVCESDLAGEEVGLIGGKAHNGAVEVVCESDLAGEEVGLIGGKAHLLWRGAGIQWRSVGYFCFRTIIRQTLSVGRHFAWLPALVSIAYTKYTIWVAVGRGW